MPDCVSDSAKNGTVPNITAASSTRAKASLVFAKAGIGAGVMPKGLSRASDFASLLRSEPGFGCANLHRYSATLRLENRCHSVHLDPEQSKGVPMSNASIGHIHLKVSNLERSIAFYRDILGFDVQQRMGNQAAFLGAGGYHHHIGLNTWESAGAKPPPAGHTRGGLPAQSRRAAAK